MFIAYLSDGSAITGRNDEVTWDSVPIDKKITALHLILPFQLHKMVDGKYIPQPHPTIMLPKGIRYYVAKQAVAQVMELNQGIGKVKQNNVAGTVTHHVAASIDDKRQEVTYITLNVKTSEIQIKKFNLVDGKLKIGDSFIADNAYRTGI